MTAVWGLDLHVGRVQSRKAGKMAGEAAAAGGAREAADAPPKKLQLKPQVVRIEVLGDEKVGKTSLICSLVSRHFSEKVPSVLLNVQIPAEESDENVIISITDTSCASASASACGPAHHPLAADALLP